MKTVRQRNPLSTARKTSPIPSVRKNRRRNVKSSSSSGGCHRPNRFRLTFYDIRPTRRVDLETTARSGNGKTADSAERTYRTIVDGSANDRRRYLLPTSCRADNAGDNGRGIAGKWRKNVSESTGCRRGSEGRGRPAGNAMQRYVRHRFNGHNV